MNKNDRTASGVSASNASQDDSSSRQMAVLDESSMSRSASSISSIVDALTADDPQSFSDSSGGISSLTPILSDTARREVPSRSRQERGVSVRGSRASVQTKLSAEPSRQEDFCPHQAGMPSLSGDSVDLEAETWIPGVVAPRPAPYSTPASQSSLDPASFSSISPIVSSDIRTSVSPAVRFSSSQSTGSVAKSLEDVDSSVSAADNVKCGMKPVEFKSTGINANRHPSSVFKGIKVSAPSVLTRSDDLNAQGFANPGILPSVDIDKSFAIPISEVAQLLQSDSSADSNTSVSRNFGQATRHKIDVMRTAPLEEPSPIANEPTAILDLPNLPGAGRKLEDIPTLRRYQKAFLQTQLFDERRFRLLGRLINYRGLDCASGADVLMSYLSQTHQSTHPVTVQVLSQNQFDRESVIRYFVQRCYKEFEQFRTYAEVYSLDGSSCDLVTSLVASRLAIFPNEEEPRKITRLLSIVEEALNLEDRRWGLDILFIRYGLRQYVSAQHGIDISSLVSRNESDMIELLESMIIHDAAQGPVVILLSLSDTGKHSVWRDILVRLRHLDVSNVLILLDGGVPVTDIDPADFYTYEVPSISERDRQLILNQLLPYLSEEELRLLSYKCGDSLTQLRRVLNLFHRQNPFENPNPLNESDILNYINRFPDTQDALAYMYYHSFSGEQCRFLSVASMLGNRFYLNDLSTLLSLEALPDEIPGFHDLRSSWCERIASQLVDSGEIFVVHQDEKRGMRFEFPEYKLFQQLSTHMDLITAQRLHGCFGRILERSGASESKIASQYEEAGMWPEAATHWLSIARRYSRNFYVQTAYTILKTCLQHIGPQYDVIYPSLLRECVTLSFHIGRYDDVCYYAGLLARMGRILSDTRCMAKAFIDMSDALRVQGDSEHAKEMAKYGLELSQRQGDDHLISLSNHTIGKIIFESGAKGSLVKALRYAEKALETRRLLGDLRAISQTQALCARIYLRRGEPTRAKTAALEAYHALMASGHWYDTPIALISLAESTSALQEAMMDNYLERGFAIVEKTGAIEHHFRLLTSQVLVSVNTLQRQTVRTSLEVMRQIIKTYPVAPWIATYHLLTAMFDFSRKNFQKTTKALRCFFDAAQKLGNSYIMALGYSLSAELNFEVYKRNLSTVSLEKTEKLYLSATSLFESVGAWHEVARTLRLYGAFLEDQKRPEDASAAYKRADKVDPYSQ